MKNYIEKGVISHILDLLIYSYHSCQLHPKFNDDKFLCFQNIMLSLISINSLSRS